MRRGDYVSTQQLWSYFAQYLYLPRLRDRSVLVGAIESGAADLGWEQDTFAYAQSYDADSGRFRGLAGVGASVLIDGASVVVKSGAARRQRDADSIEAESDARSSAGGVEAGASTTEHSGDVTTSTEATPVVGRFYGVKALDPQRVSRDADQIATEIVSHLVGLVGANVEVRLEITAVAHDGVPDDVRRTVTENAKTLKFEQHGFEEI